MTRYAKSATAIFQLTRSRGARPSQNGVTQHPRTFQLTRSRGARPPKQVEVVILGQISTHALTWSATRREKSVYIDISNFNSRAHVERDKFRCVSPCDAVNFNSRAHVERDGTAIFRRPIFYNFNSRAHVERDLLCPCGATTKSNFNSRAHVERDLDVVAVGRLLHMIRIRSFLVCKISARCS